MNHDGHRVSHTLFLMELQTCKARHHDGREPVDSERHFEGAICHVSEWEERVLEPSG